MSAKLGLVGLPNAGKSSLFNALTSGKAQVAPYPFTTKDPNVGVAAVADARLAKLAALIPHDKLIPTAVEFVDIAGLVKGAHQGEGLGNQFLSHVFAVDALLHVVRCFSDGNVPHPMGECDPVRDVEIINTELMLKDLEIIDRRLEKERKVAKGGDKHAAALIEHLTRWKAHLEQGQPMRRAPLSVDERPNAFGIDLLTSKPVIYVANVDEGSDAPSSAERRLSQIAADEGAQVVRLCVKLEADLVELEPAERETMMKELGLASSGLPSVIQEGYRLLRYLSFFTTASKMIQAWTVIQGTKAPQAAGVIHTDFERKFISAEVIPVETLIGAGSESSARAKGLVRLEGKEYVVRDGDVIHFKIGQ